MSRTPATDPTASTSPEPPAPRVGAWAEFDAGAHDPSYDALADLFLGEPSAAPRPPAPTQTPAPATLLAAAVDPAPASSGHTMELPAAGVQVLVMGHVPVMAPAWIRQYARHLCDHGKGPVAILSVCDGMASVDLVGATAEPQNALGPAIAAASSACKTWLVRVDDTLESTAIAACPKGALTLLTGADEAAVVGAYRAVKAVLAPASRERRVYAVVTGSPTPLAFSAFDRLSRASRAILGSGVTLAAVLPRINAEPGHEPAAIFEGRCGDVRAALDMLRRVEPQARPATPTSPAPTSPAPRATPNIVDPTLPPPPGATPASPRGTSLIRHLRGVRSIGAICPAAPGVELGVDIDGRVHLAAEASESVDRAMGQIALASAWLAEHRALVSMLCEHLAASLDPGAAPTLHLFATDPKALRRVPDPAARLHAILSGAPHVGVVCLDLN